MDNLPLELQRAHVQQQRQQLEGGAATDPVPVDINPLKIPAALLNPILRSAHQTRRVSGGGMAMPPPSTAFAAQPQPPSQ